ncbi:MAG: hypothetical protein M1825_004044 [Sarcosagium campestre]|nr:MAG: hypothetical protein M1825_004044 [Sarcosagium campestre]
MEDQKKHRGRVVLWAFGGIVEDSEGCGSGWCWFEKSIVYENNLRVDNCGTGVVRVFVNRETGKIRAVRTTNVIFGPEEPRWGGFSSFREGGYIYLWGFYQSNLLLARVKVAFALTKSAYEFWDGYEYGKDWKKAEAVTEGVQHGKFYRSKLFEPGTGHDYVFVGVATSGTSQIVMGTAPRIEGPWKMQDLCGAPGIEYPDGFKYCIYPHPWCFREEDGEMLVTWCEQFPGGVIAGKIRLEIGTTKPFVRFSLNDLPFEGAGYVSGAAELRRVEEATHTRIGRRGRWYSPGFNPAEWQEPRLHLLVVGEKWTEVWEAEMLLTRMVSTWLTGREERTEASEEVDLGGQGGAVVVERRSWPRRASNVLRGTFARAFRRAYTN